MTDQSPPPPPEGDAESRLYAKRRLPFDARGASSKRPAGIIAAAVLYGVAMLACLGLAGFMHWGRQFPIASIQVVPPLLGAAWFLIRLMMVLRPMPPRE